MSHREGQMLTDSLDRLESALLTNQDLSFSSWVHGGGPARGPCRFDHRFKLSLQLANLHRRTSGLHPGGVRHSRRVPASLVSITQPLSWKSSGMFASLTFASAST